MERICYMNPVFGAPYGRGPSISDVYYQTNPMEEAYRYALRNLEDSFEREMRMLYELFAPYDYHTSNDYYRRKHDIKSHYYSRCERLEYDFTRNVQQYYCGYANRRISWDYGFGEQYTYKFTYLNSTTGATTPVMPTETKKYIIISSAGAAEQPTQHKTLAEAEAEATRLAKQFPKQEFTIYATAKSFKVADKPVDVKVFV